MSAPWTVTRDGALATVALTNPPENRIGFVALERLLDVLGTLADDDGVSVVLLTSAVDAVFSSGAERSDIGRLVSGDAGAEDLALWARVGEAIERLPQPVLAVVDGAAVSGGCELALSCTLRIGSRRASFAQAEIVVGAMPGAGATVRLPRIVGPGVAARMVLEGAALSAEEALACGLLDELVDDGVDVRQRAQERAAAMAQRSRTALVEAKAALREGRDLPVAEAQRREQQRFLRVLGARNEETR